MSGGEEQAGEKSFEPTERRLSEARRKGEVPRSADLTTALAYLGFVALGITFGGTLLLRLGESLMVLLDQPVALASLVFGAGGGGGGGAGAPVIGGLLLAIIAAVLPWFLLPGAMALLSEFGQQSFVFASEKLKPKLSRISPIKAIGNKFGLSGLVEFTKSFLKLLIYASVLTIYLVRRSDDLLGSAMLNAGMVSVALLRILTDLLVIVLVIAIAIGLLDLLWQRSDFLRRQRMTRKEVMDEMKESEGDPALKGQRRQRAVDLAMNQMLADVPKASVVIVNPTHFAVALEWDRTGATAPVCRAKGVDHVAARIREIALEHGVPIHSDPPTARALHAEVDIGQAIPPDQYRAVAAAIRFADAMRMKARGTGGAR
jgi:flagellar biosynthetic protein FlhB